MARHQVQGQRRLPVAVELGPVHGDDNFPSRADQMRDPVGEALPNIDLLIAEQAVNLLDRVFGHQTASLRQCLPDHRHRQRGACHDPERRPRQGIDPLGMNAVLVQIVDEIPNILQLPAKPPLRLLHGAPRSKNPPHVGDMASTAPISSCQKMRGFVRTRTTDAGTHRCAQSD